MGAPSFKLRQFEAQKTQCKFPFFSIPQKMRNAFEREEKHPGKEGKSKRPGKRKQAMGRGSTLLVSTEYSRDKREGDGERKKREKEGAGRRLGSRQGYRWDLGSWWRGISQKLRETRFAGTEVGQNKCPWEGMRLLRQNKLNGSSEVRRTASRVLPVGNQVE